MGACWESWRVLVLVGGALQKLFAVAHLLLRQEKENKLSFYLLLIAKVLLASLETLGYVWVACLGRACCFITELVIILVWRWLLQKWTEMTEALQKFSFSWMVLILVGGALQKLLLYLRDILPVPPFNNLFNN